MSLLELEQLAADYHSDHVAAQIVHNLQQNVVDMFTTWGQIDAGHELKCPKCFQILEMTAIFNTSFYPTIIAVS